MPVPGVNLLISLNHRMKASDLFVKALENEGVEYIFSIPGEENLDLLESLRKSSIKLILVRHEQAAGFMAATYGRLTGQPGVCMSTLGPGATNLLTSAAYAHLGAMPMVMITGQKPLNNRKQAAFQVIDVVGMMKPVTKFSEQVTTVNSIPFKVRQAFRLAKYETPGATHLELPEDVAQEDVGEFIIERREYQDIGKAAQAHLDKSVEIIKKAQHPLIMIGANAKRIETCKAVSEFIQKTKIPFFCTQMGKGAVDERSSYYIGTAALSESDYVHDAIEASDLIINIGHDIVEKPPFVAQAGTFDVLHINYKPAHIVEVYQPRYELIGDIRHSIEQLGEALQGGQWDFEPFEKVKKIQRQKIWEAEVEVSFPVKPQHLVRIVQKTMPETGTLTLDNGMYKIWFARNYKAEHPNAVLLDNALATMGAGLPSAIAAKIVFPERKVMAICGDGGFMMNSAELETAVRLQLDLVVMIINDKGLGMIKWKQGDMGFEDYGLSHGNPDFVAYAESYGATGHTLEKGEQLEEVLSRCLNGKGVHLIEVPIDYSENHKVFSKEIKGEHSFS